MITHWKEICAQVENSEVKLQEFINTAALSALQIKKLQQFIKEWNQVKKLAEQFDEFISPVDHIEMQSPFDQEDFRYMSKMWKEYLQEQHGTLMRSRSEQMSLDLLTELAENDVDKAIFYLRFAIAHRYRKFFIVDEKAKSTPELTKENVF